MIPYKLTSWVEKGITTVGDILDENGDIQGKDYIQSTWNVTCNFLLYLSLKKKFNSLLVRGTQYTSILFHNYHTSYIILRLVIKVIKMLSEHSREGSI